MDDFSPRGQVCLLERVIFDLISRQGSTCVAEGMAKAKAPRQELARWVAGQRRAGFWRDLSKGRVEWWAAVRALLSL